MTRAQKQLLRSAVICFCGLTIGTPSIAQEIGSETANRELLEELLNRRAEVVQSGSSEVTREALTFLDARIAEVTNRELLNALLQRRAEVAQSNHQDAVAFLDKRIAEMRTRLRD